MSATQTASLRAASPWDLQRVMEIARRHTLVWTTLTVAGVLCLITFVAGGGLTAEGQDLGPMTTVELVITLGAGAIIAAAILLTARGRPVWGIWSIGLLAAFTALCALSVIWSVSPDASWQNADQILAYTAVFATAALLARAAPDHWPAILGGIVLAAVVVCGYALATKVFPAQLDVGDTAARLRAPYDYWNAIGLNAAIGVVCCLWLGTRRSGHALVSALAYPAMGLGMVTLMLAYSRGALAVLVLGLALWLCMVPLRLRSVVVLAVSGAGAAVVVAWDFSQHALTTEDLSMTERVPAGRQLGVLLVAMILALTVVGLAITFMRSRRAPSIWVRRRAGAALLGILALAVVAVLGGLAASPRGLFGTISHDVSTVVNPNAPVPPNTPGRLTAIGSVRARYWKEALEIFKAHPVAGTGARTYGTARLRYRNDDISVMDAHGYIVQTLSDLGLVGLAITLALLAVWLAAAGRATHPFNRRWSRWRWRSQPLPYPPERIGMLAMLVVVVVFGMHSFVDWTWFIPGDACVALLCAGWLAGRGPLAFSGIAPAGRSADPPARRAQPATVATRRVAAEQGWMGSVRRRLRDAGPARTATALAVIVAALLAGWAQWQPLRSAEGQQAALLQLAGHPRQALASARTAVDRDPLSAEALFTLASVQRAVGDRHGALSTLQRAVRLQPSNPQTWLRLGEYQLAGDPAAALKDMQAVIYLNPQSISAAALASGNPEYIEIHNYYLQALTATTPAA